MHTSNLNRVSFALVPLFALALLSFAAAASAQPDWRPTEHHELLKKDVGTWDGTMKLWFEPDAEPIVSEVVETNRLLDGGLWLITDYKGDLADMPFVGFGTFGYDPIKKKYVGTWVDNVTPYLSVSEGDYDHETNTLTMTTDRREPETGELSTLKQILRHVDDNTRMFEIRVPGPDGQDWKMLEVEYRRRAE